MTHLLPPDVLLASAVPRYQGSIYSFFNEHIPSWKSSQQVETWQFGKVI